MSKEQPIIEESEAFVEAYMSSQCRKFIGRCEDLQEGKSHPDWRTAEALVKVANQSMDQVAPDIAQAFHFYIHFSKTDYTVDTQAEEDDE